MTSTATTKDLEKQLADAQADCAAAEAREQAATARAAQLGVFQGQAAALADENATQAAKIVELEAANAQLDRDAKAARAAAGSVADGQGASAAKVRAAEQLAAAIRTLLG